MSALRHRLHCHRRVALSRHCGISYCLSLIYVRLQNRCFIAPRLQRAGVRKTARCHCVEQHHAGSVCNRLVTRPSPTRSGLARDLNSCSQRKCCAIEHSSSLFSTGKLVPVRCARRAQAPHRGPTRLSSRACPTSALGQPGY